MLLDADRLDGPREMLIGNVLTSSLDHSVAYRAVLRTMQKSEGHPSPYLTDLHARRRTLVGARVGALDESTFSSLGLIITTATCDT
jgi:hypothetical protein